MTQFATKNGKRKQVIPFDKYLTTIAPTEVTDHPDVATLKAQGTSTKFLVRKKKPEKEIQRPKYEFIWHVKQTFGMLSAAIYYNNGGYKTIAEVTLLAGRLWTKLAPQHTSKTRMFCDLSKEDTYYIGSKHIEGYVPLLGSDKTTLSSELILPSLITISLISIFLAERDLHISNVGLAKKVLKKIDHDGSLDMELLEKEITEVELFYIEGPVVSKLRRELLDLNIALPVIDKDSPPPDYVRTIKKISDINFDAISNIINTTIENEVAREYIQKNLQARYFAIQSFYKKYLSHIVIEDEKECPEVFETNLDFTSSLILAQANSPIFTNPSLSAKNVNIKKSNQQTNLLKNKPTTPTCTIL